MALFLVVYDLNNYLNFVSILIDDCSVVATHLSVSSCRHRPGVVGRLFHNTRNHARGCGPKKPVHDRTCPQRWQLLTNEQPVGGCAAQITTDRRWCSASGYPDRPRYRRVGELHGHLALGPGDVSQAPHRAVVRRSDGTTACPGPMVRFAPARIQEPQDSHGGPDLGSRSQGARRQTSDCGCRAPLTTLEPSQRIRREPGPSNHPLN